MASRTRSDQARPANGGARAKRGVANERRQQRASGRYTPPTPRQVRHSPAWYPWLLLTLAIIGVGLIIANYSSALPGSPTNWYTLGALIALLGSALLATRYH